jgi:hypothetical protein
MSGAHRQNSSDDNSGEDFDPEEDNEASTSFGKDSIDRQTHT